jgi:hypothetical protein
MCVSSFDFFCLAKETSATFNDTYKEKKVNNGKTDHNSLQSSLLLENFMSQIHQFPLGLFCRLPHFPNILMCTRELMSLCPHLRHDRRCSSLCLKPTIQTKETKTGKMKES